MNDATVVSGLVPGRGCFFLQQQNAGLPRSSLQLPGSGQPHDSGTYNDEVVFQESAMDVSL
jgi:hypothetical protein